MKRIVFLFMTACIMLLTTSCGEPPSVAGAFSASFDVSGDDVGYAGRLRLDDGGLSVEMTAPYTVEGIRFVYTDEGLSIDGGGLSTRVNCDYIPAGALPSVLHNTLTYLGQAEYVGSDGGEDSFTLPSPYGDAVIKAREGIPVSLSDPFSGLEFTFANAEISDNHNSPSE